MKRDIRKIQKRLQEEDSSVFSATFIFRIKKEDTEFERFNTLIDQAAAENSGFLGKERWSRPEENQISVVYYWDSLESLNTFSKHPDHQRAKQKYKQWYDGYEVIISKVLKLKGDEGL